MKDALTTGEVAKYCGVNFRTVIRWIEKGYLESYKLPGRGDNRVPINAFFAFLKHNNMPIPAGLNTNSDLVEARSTKPPKTQKQKVLIIEDEELMAKSMKRTIVRAGYEVEIASNGIEAGIQLERYSPDIVTLDLQMPGMSGFDVLEALKANDKYVDIKVLVVSAATKVKILEVLEIGANDVLEKPFKANDLKLKLDTLACLK